MRKTRDAGYRIIAASSCGPGRQPTGRSTVPTTPRIRSSAISDCACQTLDRNPSSSRHVPRQRRLPLPPSTVSPLSSQSGTCLACRAHHWCFAPTCFPEVCNTASRLAVQRGGCGFLAWVCHRLKPGFGCELQKQIEWVRHYRRCCWLRYRPDTEEKICTDGVLQMTIYSQNVQESIGRKSVNPKNQKCLAP